MTCKPAGLVLSDIFTCNNRHSTDREVALMMLLAYLSYMIAEVTQPSSIKKKEVVKFSLLKRKCSVFRLHKNSSLSN